MLPLTSCAACNRPFACSQWLSRGFPCDIFKYTGVLQIDNFHESAPLPPQMDGVVLTNPSLKTPVKAGDMLYCIRRPDSNITTAPVPMRHLSEYASPLVLSPQAIGHVHGSNAFLDTTRTRPHLRANTSYTHRTNHTYAHAHMHMHSTVMEQTTCVNNNCRSNSDADSSQTTMALMTRISPCRWHQTSRRKHPHLLS